MERLEISAAAALAQPRAVPSEETMKRENRIILLWLPVCVAPGGKNDCAGALHDALVDRGFTCGPSFRNLCFGWLEGCETCGCGADPLHLRLLYYVVDSEHVVTPSRFIDESKLEEKGGGCCVCLICSCWRPCSEACRTYVASPTMYGVQSYQLIARQAK
jgi:hypothetical protein